MKSVEWDDALVAEHRNHLDSVEARAAFDEMVSTAIALPHYECGPGWHGVIREFRYGDRASGERPFAFAINVNDLRFYVRAAGLARVPGGLPALQASFERVEVNPSGEWKVWIATRRDAKALARLVFGMDDEETQALREQEAEAEERRIEQRIDIGPTQVSTLVNARRGQGVYKQNLTQFETHCRLTGIADLEHLRASHIKPWAQCNDQEKLDGFNGLLLSPHVDHLFDRGYISFSDSGEVLVSRALNSEVLRSWGIGLPQNVGPFRAEQCKYLDYHRKEVFEHGRAGPERQDEANDATLQIPTVHA